MRRAAGIPPTPQGTNSALSRRRQWTEQPRGGGRARGTTRSPPPPRPGRACSGVLRLHRAGRPGGRTTTTTTTGILRRPSPHTGERGQSPSRRCLPRRRCMDVQLIRRPLLSLSPSSSSPSLPCSSSSSSSTHSSLSCSFVRSSSVAPPALGEGALARPPARLRPALAFASREEMKKEGAAGEGGRNRRRRHRHRRWWHTWTEAEAVWPK